MKACALASMLGALLLGGCFSFSVQTPGEPLPPQELRMRTDTRQFAAQMSESVQRTADAIAAQSTDAAVRAAALRWKLGTSVAIRRAAYRTIPRHALVDTWAFAEQMERFFREGNGRELFGERQSEAVKETARLAEEARALAARHLDSTQLARNGDLVRAQAANEPLADLDFVRAPVALSAVLAGAQPPATAGSATDVAADAIERFDLYGHSIPDEARWRTELLIGESGIKGSDVVRLLSRTEETLHRIYELAETEPGKAAAMLEEARADLQRGWAQVDQRWVETLGVLQVERAALARTLESAQTALDATIQRERTAFYAALSQERTGLAADAERYTLRIVEEARSVAREAVVWFFGLIALVLGTTFAIGFVLGRATQRRGPDRGG
jgi:hypothetical protein